MFSFYHGCSLLIYLTLHFLTFSLRAVIAVKVYIDYNNDKNKRRNKEVNFTMLFSLPKLRRKSKKERHLYSLLASFLCMSVTTAVSFLYCRLVPENSANIALLYILALIIICRISIGYMYGLVCSVIAVICVNFLFTYPYFKINFTMSGYPITFLVMLIISIMASTTTSHLTMQAEIIAEREKQLAEAEMEKMRANLLRAISHDLRTPLTGIIGNSSLFLENQKRLSREEQREIVENIYNDSDWLLNMVENLLTVTRIQGDNLAITTSEESVEEVISEALQKLHKRHPEVTIHVEFPENYIMLPMDAILIEQVTINLLENAILHANSAKPIELLVEENANDVSFTVRDYGKGLPPQMLNNLFDGTTYAPAQTSDARKGMGIGLSICKTIITAHHGTLIGRNHSSGAEFIFTLPKNK